ncbi:MAG: hypothetical protein WBQ49_21425 [Rhodomicrobium sp.]
MASEARNIVESVLGADTTARIWTSNYLPVLPFTPQGFSVGAVLPMLLYLFRWGHRRGKGKFEETFRSERGKPTVRSVAEILAKDSRFSGFENESGKAILGDLLLTGVLENARHSEGHDEQVQRCYAAHYFASWIDLPKTAANLRGVPEAIVAIVANQANGATLGLSEGNSFFPVGSRVESNIFLRAFAPGVTEALNRMNLAGDGFDETADVGLDQLLAIRLAQRCGEAPQQAKGRNEPGPIQNQWPLARHAAMTFREDLLTFFKAYGACGSVPRHALLPMLETAIAIGMSTILTATIGIVESWSHNGRVPGMKEQRPWPLFIDASMWSDLRLRELSEQSSELLRRRLSKLPAALMYMRLLDHYVRVESDIDRKDLPPTAPDATGWLDLLGAIASGEHEEGRDAERFFRSNCRKLVDAIKDDANAGLRADILRDENSRRHGERLAEALTLAYERVAGGDKMFQFLSSALMTDEPNGLARRRRVKLGRPGRGGRKTADVTSFVLTNTVLEYLVHRHLRRGNDPRKREHLSFPKFLQVLRERYGFFVDQAPPGMSVPSELLERNRRHLERRLRDLALLVGVNDAERMKKLRSRYESTYERQDSHGEAA